MKYASNTIKALDQIGPQIAFKYQDKTRIQTVFGGLLTAVMIVVGALGFVYFSRDMFFRTNPITKENEIVVDEARMPFTEYPIGILLTDVFFRPILPGDPIFESLEILPQYYFARTVDNVLTVETGYFGLMPCNEEYFAKFKGSYGSSINKNSLCIDYSKSFNFDGTPSQIDAEFYNYKSTTAESSLDVKLRLCDEKKKPGCSKAFLQAGQIQYVLSNLKELVNFDDYSSPIERQIEFYNGNVTPGFFIRKTSMISLNKLITDDGFILGSRSTIDYIDTKLNDTQIASFNSTTRNLYAYHFTVQTNQKILERRYVKIQEILANIGGFMKMLFFVATLLTKHFSLYSFYSEFGNEINNIAKSLESSKNAFPPNNFLKNAANKSANQSSTAVLDNALRKPNVNTDIGFRKFVTSFFSREKENKTNLNRVFQYLDISFLTKRLIEVEINMNR